MSIRKILILVVLGFGCSVDKRTTNESNLEKDTTSTSNQVDTTLTGNFMNFISRLSKVDLPYEVGCDACCEPDRNGISAYALEEDFPELFDYIPGGSNLWLLGRTNGKVIILATYVRQSSHPLIVVCDVNGNKIGAESFFDEDCGRTDESASKQSLSIGSDLSITSIDTIYYFEVDTEDYHIVDTTDIKIVEKSFIINDLGKVVEQNKGEIVAGKLAKSFIKTDIDTSLFFGIWASDPDGPHADFIFSKNSYLIVDSDDNGEMSYELLNKNLKIFFNDFVQEGEVTSVDKSTLKIKWKGRSQIDSYVRWNK